MGMPVGASGGFSAPVSMPVSPRMSAPPPPPPPAQVDHDVAADALNASGPRGTKVNTKA